MRKDRASKKGSVALKVVAGILGVAVVAGGSFLVVKHFRGKQDASVSSADSEYEPTSDLPTSSRTDSEKTSDIEKETESETTRESQDEATSETEKESEKPDYSLQKEYFRDWIGKIDKMYYELALDYGDHTMNYVFNPKIVKSQSGDAVAYYVFGNDNYVVASQDGKKFTKETSTLSDPREIFNNSIESAEYVSYDSPTRTHFVNANGVDYAVNIDISGDATLSCDDFSAQVSNVGNVELLVAPEIKTSPNLYTIDSKGNYIFDKKLTTDIFLDYMAGNNPFGKHIFQQIIDMRGWKQNYKPEIYAVLAADYSDKEFRLDAVFSDGGSRKVGKIYLDDPDLFQGFKNGTIKTADDFKEYLWSLTLISNKHVEKMVHTDTSNNKILEAENEEGFVSSGRKALWDRVNKNIFKKLKNVGTQSSMKDVNPNSKIDMSQYNILYTYKMPVLSLPDAGNLGILHSIPQVFMAEKDGRLYQMTVRTYSSVWKVSDKNQDVQEDFRNILVDEKDDCYKWWYVGGVYIKEFDKSNLALYSKANEKIKE